MFNKSVDNTRHVNGPAHTLVSRSTEIVGDIHFSGELIIEGKVKGNIYAEDDSEALIRVAGFALTLLRPESLPRRIA